MTAFGGVGDFFCVVGPGAVIVVPNFGDCSLIDFDVVVDVLAAVKVAVAADESIDVFAGCGDAIVIVCDVVRDRLGVLFP